MGSSISLIPANICCFNSSCSGLSSLTFASVDSMVVSTGMLVVSQLALFFGGDFCELELSSQLHLLFLPEEALGFNCSFMLICLVAHVVFKLFALDEVLSIDFLSPSDSLSASFLLLLRFNLLSKLCLLSCDILQIMLSYLLDCYYLSSDCFHLFPLVPTHTFPQVRVNVAFLYYHSFKIEFFCYVQLFP